MLNKDQFFIQKELGTKILMIGVFFKNNAPGGMASVIQYYEKYFEELRYIPSWKMSNSFVKLLYSISSLILVILHLLFDWRIKLLHIHSAADKSFWRKSIFVKIGKFFNKKVVFHIHASRFRDFYNESEVKKKIIENLMMVDCLIVLSESWKKWFIEIGVCEANIEVLNNITDYPSINKNINLKGQRIHFLFLGELGDRKGVFDILRGLTKYKEDLRDKIEFRIGGNTNEDKLLKIIREGDLQDFVKFEGWVTGDKKIKLLNWADVYILASKNEGLPIGILEAMSYGCPIISTPVGGIPEVVFPKENGILVTPGSEEEIILAIKRYASKNSIIKQEGEESKKIAENYLPKPVLTHLKKIYFKTI